MGTFVVGVEGMYAAGSLILGGTAAACPDLRISFSHAAGGFAMALPRANYFGAAPGTKSRATSSAP